MKEYFPTRYEELKQRVKEGRWHVTGSSWDANDVLVPSAESVLRNICTGRIIIGLSSEQRVRISFCPTALALGGHCRRWLITVG